MRLHIVTVQNNQPNKVKVSWMPMNRQVFSLYFSPAIIPNALTAREIPTIVGYLVCLILLLQKPNTGEESACPRLYTAAITPKKFSVELGSSCNEILFFTVKTASFFARVVKTDCVSQLRWRINIYKIALAISCDHF